MKIKMIIGTNVAANEWGSKTVFWKKGSKHESSHAWETAMFVDLIDAGIAVKVMPVEDGIESKALGSAPENKALEPGENKWRSEHKGGGRWMVLNPEGEQIGGLYSGPEAEALAKQYNEGG